LKAFAAGQAGITRTLWNCYLTAPIFNYLKTYAPEMVRTGLLWPFNTWCRARVQFL